MSFYYWRTGFSLDSLEKKTLRDNSVQQLYVRYFDIDFPAGQAQPLPVSPLRADSSIRAYAVVPVIYIRNKVFERLDSSALPDLAGKVLALVTQINRSQGIRNREIQFDCDWTEKTKTGYFDFLRQYKALSRQPVSATIRLHQVKYPEKTGIPPVDHGVLMYYNMGAINAGDQNSIYEKSTADRYNSYIKNYPLTLDVALPIFAWSLKIADGRVLQLLDKINFTRFENDSNFSALKENRFRAKHACFKAGYYFRENDLVKTEQVPAAWLLEMAGDIRRFSNNRIRNLIFYDIDSTNLVLYDTAIFQKVLHTLP